MQQVPLPQPHSMQPQRQQQHPRDAVPVPAHQHDHGRAFSSASRAPTGSEPAVRQHRPLPPLPLAPSLRQPHRQDVIDLTDEKNNHDLSRLVERLALGSARPSAQAPPKAPSSPSAVFHPAALTPGVRPWASPSVLSTSPLSPSRAPKALPVPPPWEGALHRPSSAPAPPGQYPATPPRPALAHSHLLAPHASPERARPRPRSTESERSPSISTPPPRAAAPSSAAQSPAVVIDAAGRQQCAGIKKDGTRCTRFVAGGTAKSRSRSVTPAASPAKGGASPARGGSAAPSAASAAELQSAAAADGPDYCFQHAAEINKTSSFVLPNGRNVPFADYIPASLSPRAQARLRTVMSTAPTHADLKERGYCYIYELRDRARRVQPQQQPQQQASSAAAAPAACFKVGRSINVFKRLDEWRGQCQSKDPLLRCFLPAQEGQMLLAGASTATVPGLLLSRRWERLCHLELEDVGTRVNEPCKDCKSRHREMFMVDLDAGGYDAVREIVERWMRFVQQVAKAY